MPAMSKFTLPVGVPLPLVLVTVAVKVTGLPYVDGLALEVTAVVVDVLPLNVTVNAALLPATPVQGVVVPEQVVGLKSVTRLQPPNVDPPLALALSVIVAALAEVVIFGEHV